VTLTHRRQFINFVIEIFAENFIAEQLQSYFIDINSAEVFWRATMVLNNY